jgi:hypothetical protein
VDEAHAGGGSVGSYLDGVGGEKWVKKWGEKKN